MSRPRIVDPRNAHERVALDRYGVATPRDVQADVDAGRAENRNVAQRPRVTGATDGARLTSLIEAARRLGLIDDATEPFELEPGRDVIGAVYPIAASLQEPTTASSADTANLVTALETTVTLPNGNYHVQLVGSLLAKHSAGTRVLIQTLIDGSNLEAMTVSAMNDATPGTAILAADVSTAVTVSDGDLTLTLKYRPVDTGTATVKAAVLWGCAVRVA